MKKRRMLQLALVSAACSEGQPSSQIKNVFGRDDRIEVTEATGTFTSIGRLDSGCTGSVIAPNLILTAAHCLFATDGTLRPNAFTFRSHFRAGTAQVQRRAARAYYGTDRPDEEREQDWAVFELEASGSAVGAPLPIDADMALTAALPYIVSLAGFSGDVRGGAALSLHRNCSVRSRVGSRLLNDCDSTAGISGAPMLAKVGGNTVIVGLEVSEYRQGANHSQSRCLRRQLRKCGDRRQSVCSARWSAH